MITILLDLNASIKALKEYEQSIITQLSSEHTEESEILDLVRHLRQIREGRTQIESGINLISQINQEEHLKNTESLINRAIQNAKKEIESVKPLQSSVIYTGNNCPRPMFDAETKNAETKSEESDPKIVEILPTLKIEPLVSLNPKDHWNRITRYILNQLAVSNQISVRELVENVMGTQFFPKELEEEDIRTAFKSRIRRLKERRYVANEHKGQEYTLTETGRFYIYLLYSKDTRLEQEKEQKQKQIPSISEEKKIIPEKDPIVEELFQQENPTDWIQHTPNVSIQIIP